MKKISLFLCLLVSTSMILTACQPLNSSEDTDNKYILNKILPKEIDLPLAKESLNQEETKKIIEKYLNLLNQNFDVDLENYDIGDLDGDSIDEIVMYVNEESGKDNKGKLLVYSYDGEGYFLLDEIEIKFDKKNIELRVGKISDDKEGIIISNLANDETTVIYVYIIDDGKLVTAINPKKVNLFSINGSPEIKDVDGDGILNFNICTYDPELDKKEDSKIVIWYKWDGKDSAKVVRKDYLSEESEEYDINQKYSVISANALTIDDLYSKADEMTKTEFSELLSEYLMLIDSNLENQNIELAKNIFGTDKRKYDYLFNNHESIGIDELKKRTTLIEDKELNDYLTNNIKKGYMITKIDGKLELKIDYDYFIKSFDGSLTNEMLSYLRIKDAYENRPITDGTILLVDKNEIAMRLSEIENFRLVFPYSTLLDEVLNIYNSYLDALLFLDDEKENVTKSEYKIDAEYKEELVKIKEAYPKTYFSELIERMLTLVEGIGGGAITPTIKDYIRDIF